jgi:hypothetical protein
VRPFITAGAGFLLAVLWFDLMFDVQVAGHPAGDLPDAVVASISGYYRRVTTLARPMNRLVAAAMLATLGAIIAQIARGEDPHWAAWVALGLAGSAILVASVHTVPAAIRLGAGVDPLGEQTRLARSIFRDHLVCLTAIVALLVVELAT